MTTSSPPAGIAATGATDRTGTTASPRVKLSRRRISIDHPDPRAGERLLAEALGAVDRDALDGLLKQLVRVSAIGQRADEANLAFMISMIKSIAPRDSIEAMLVAQMVCVHVTAMRSAQHLACAGDLANQDSASRALAKLVRAFLAQVEALGRYRDIGARAITVQSLPAQSGKEPIEGKVSHQPNLIASAPRRAGAAAGIQTTCDADEHRHEPARAMLELAS